MQNEFNDLSDKHNLLSRDALQIPRQTAHTVLKKYIYRAWG